MQTRCNPEQKCNDSLNSTEKKNFSNFPQWLAQCFTLRDGIWSEWGLAANPHCAANLLFDCLDLALQVNLLLINKSIVAGGQQSSWRSAIQWYFPLWSKWVFSVQIHYYANRTVKIDLNGVHRLHKSLLGVLELKWLM